MKKAVGTDKSSLQRIFNSTRYYEGQPRRYAPAPTPPVYFPTSCLMVTTTTIGPATTTVMGSGSAKFEKFDDSTATVSDIDSTTYTIYNMTDKTVASGALIFCSPAYGYLWVVNAHSCGNLS